MAAFSIRAGVPADAPALLDLIKGLADYERGLHLVTNTPEAIVADAFGPSPCCSFALAFVAGQEKPAGMAIWYYRYSSWQGRSMYLEDLFVWPEHRGLGIGKALFMHVAKLAEAEKLAAMCWQVLDWNTPAIDFYHRLGATVGGDGFVNARLNAPELKTLLAQNQ